MKEIARNLRIIRLAWAVFLIDWAVDIVTRIYYEAADWGTPYAPMISSSDSLRLSSKELWDVLEEMKKEELT